MAAHYFISYSNVDSKIDVRRLADDLAADSPSIPVWVDARELQAGGDWDEQIVEALRTCVGVLFLMTQDSVQPKSECKREWTRALRYKKPVIPLLCDRDAEMPYRLEPRQHIDFTGAYQQSLGKLRQHLRWRNSPEGELASLKERFADAERALARADEQDKARIEDDITDLKARIATKQRSLDNPTAAAETTQARISSGLERERAPAEPERPETRTKFINPPPASAPAWFQDRHVETGLIGDFLNDDALRLITVVGRGGIGKTAMVCRLLKALESGRLPDDGGPLPVDGIVYLSPMGSRQLTFAHCYADLCKLLPAQSAKGLETIYQTPQATTTAKMQALLEAFPAGRTVVLLDNFEAVVDAKTGQIRDAELDEALQALLNLPQHGVRVIITTREAPRPLLLTQPGRQSKLELDQGLESPYAENILKAMDADGKLGLRDAPAALLDEARVRTRGYPRALEAFAAILAADRDTSLDELLTDIERLSSGHVVKVLVGEAFSRLDDPAQQVMQALAVYAGPVALAAVDYLLQPHVPNIDSAPLLRRLVNMQFARSETGHYYLHQVDRAYALGRIPEGDPADREATPARFTRFALRHRAADYFAQTRTPHECWKRIDDLAPQLAEFELRVAGEEYDTAASVLLDIDSDYLMLWGHARLTAEFHERLQGRLGDRKLISASLRKLGNCYGSLGDIQSAIDHQEQSLAIAREIGDRRGEGAAFGNLGYCYFRLGDYQRAISCQKQCLDIAREIKDHQGEGISLNHLGNWYYSQGDYPDAIGQYKQRLNIAREIKDRRGEGISLNNLGNCYYSQGDYPDAIGQYKQSLAIAREIGDREGEGSALGNLGNCYYSQGDYQRATDHQKQSLAIAREIGDRYGEGAALTYLGDIYRETGDGARAINYYQEAIRLADATGGAQVQNEARHGLALAHLYAGDLVATHVAIEAAQEHDYPQNNAAVWATAGIIRLRQGQSAEAREAFAKALAEADGLLEKTARNLSALDSKALALCGLALCEDANHVAAAVAVYRAARKISKAAGVTASALKCFDALAAADAAGVLSGVRDAVAGQ